MEPSTISADACRLVRTMQVFGTWVYSDHDLAQRELLTNKLARLDVTRTRLVLTEWGRALPRAPHGAQFEGSAASAHVRAQPPLI